MKIFYLLVSLCAGTWEDGKCGVWNMVPVVATDSLEMCEKIMSLNRQQYPKENWHCLDQLPLGAGQVPMFTKRRPE